MKIRHTGLGMAAGLVFSLASTAGGMGAIQEEPAPINSSSCGQLITLSFGPAWYNESQNAIRDFRFPFLHTFVPHQVSGVLGSSELFFALTRPLDYYVSGQLGIAVGYNAAAKQDGTLYIDVPPILVSDYAYRLSNARIALKGKLVADWGYVVQPYVSASAGVGFNRSWGYGYNIPSSAFFPLPDIRPYMADNTTVAFTYTAGLGIQANINDNWQVGAGYEFTDWGKNNFKNLRVRSSNRFTHLLNSPTFYTNALQIGVTYKFTNGPVYG